jgi:tetratricopeptide (TPR) repeat protein
VGLVFVLGLSVHLFLPIRAGLDPVINEADPSTLDNFWKVLSRDQYKPDPPWEFRAGAYAKFVTHFWNYWEPQYHAGVKFFWAVPFILGLWGGFVNAWRSRRTFILMAFVMLVSSIGLIWHLNFKADEVRERDYFFVALFHFFAIWIGVGGAGLVYLVREALGNSVARNVAGWATAALLMLLPIGQLNAGWFEHDRSRFLVARDYAYNMLEPLEPNAILLTNGDNDTFPLWYLQEVEGVRKDVRVANLSLLNTDWYIKQLRDTEPTVPITWSDEVVDNLQFLYDSATNRIVQIKDQAVAHILATNNWERPVYIAVTVPDLMGLDDYLRMEGLSWEIEPQPTNDEIDAVRVREMLEKEFRWGGLLDEEGKLDRTIYRDPNAMKLAQNYAAAYVRLGIHYERQARDLADAGDQAGSDDAMREAIAMVRRAEQFKEGFTVQSIAVGSMHHALGEYSQAESVYTHLMDVISNEVRERPEVLEFAPEIHARRAESRFGLDDYAGALDDYKALVSMMPEAWEAWEGIVRAYIGLGREADATKTVETWLRDHPGHESAQRWLGILNGGGEDNGGVPSP